jgi:hypothetical protein
MRPGQCGPAEMTIQLTMRSSFFLLPAALLAFGHPAAAGVIQSLEAAQALVYPGATFTPADFTLTDDQVDRLKSDYSVPLMRPAVKAWRVSTGGWLFLDQVYGLNDILSYLVGVSDDGAVVGVEILECNEEFCGISAPDWRAEFVGKTAGRWDPQTAISNISGASNSSVHVAEGVKKILAIHAKFMPKSP